MLRIVLISDCSSLNHWLYLGMKQDLECLPNVCIKRHFIHMYTSEYAFQGMVYEICISYHLEIIQQNYHSALSLPRDCSLSWVSSHIFTQIKPYI